MYPYGISTILYFYASVLTTTFSYISNLHDVWKLLKCKTDNLFYEYEPSEETGVRWALLIFVLFILLWREFLVSTYLKNVEGFWKDQPGRDKCIQPVNSGRDMQNVDCGVDKVSGFIHKTNQPLVKHFQSRDSVCMFETSEWSSRYLNSCPILNDINF